MNRFFFVFLIVCSSAFTQCKVTVTGACYQFIEDAGCHSAISATEFSLGEQPVGLVRLIYDSNGRLERKNEFIGTEGAELRVSRMYTRNEQGQLERLLSYQVDDGNETLFTDYSFTYRSKGTLERRSRYSKDGVEISYLEFPDEEFPTIVNGKDGSIIERFEFVYNEHGISSYNFYNRAGTVPASTIEYTYDDLGRMAKRQHYIYLNTNRLENGYFTYNY